MRRITAEGHYGMSIGDLCEATGQSKISVSKQLYRLESEGKAFNDGRGGAQRYYLFADAR
jgi:DNA-binding transcriptional regulator GbsR (MarR family)